MSQKISIVGLVSPRLCSGRGSRGWVFRPVELLLKKNGFIVSC